MGWMGGGAELFGNLIALGDTLIPLPVGIHHGFDHVSKGREGAPARYASVDMGSMGIHGVGNESMGSLEAEAGFE